MLRVLLVGAIFTVASLSSANADDPVIVKAEAHKSSNGHYRFSVTVKHADTGWKHYVNKWDVVTLDGKLLGSRTLWHPHVNEQPFTHSLDGVKISDDTKKVKIRVHDNVHGYGKKEYEIHLEK